MDLDDDGRDVPHPTDAESWNYLVLHGDRITHKTLVKTREAICEVLYSKWSKEGYLALDVHYFGLIWSDLRYRSLATKLASGPWAKLFDIQVLMKLRLYRLEGYWDALLDDGADWAEMVFKESQSRVSLKDFDAILACCCPSSQGADDYKLKLRNLFWDGGKSHISDARKERFLTHLLFTEYSDAYEIITEHPPDPKWNFVQITEEIKNYGAKAKLVMLHVTYWYNITLKEPPQCQAVKDPIYFHLQAPFCKILSRRTQKDADEEWKAKAIALQRVVLNFIRPHKKELRGPFTMSTLKFSQPPEIELYHERFIKGRFWDLLAREIRHKFPEFPFQHPDLQKYNTIGDNINQSYPPDTPSSTLQDRAPRNSLPIQNLAAGEGDEVSAEIVDLIGEEYGSDASSMGQISKTKRRSKASKRRGKSSRVSGPTHRLPPRKQSQRNGNEYNVPSSDMESSDSIQIVEPVGQKKRKFVDMESDFNDDESLFEFTPLDDLGNINAESMILDSTSRDSTATGRASRILKTGRRDVNFFREQVRQESSPSKGLQGPDPTTSVGSNGLASNPALSKNGRLRSRTDTQVSNGPKQTPSGLLSFPWRRFRNGKRPAEATNSSPSSMLASAANNGRPVSKTPTRPRSDSPIVAPTPALMQASHYTTKPSTIPSSSHGQSSELATHEQSGGLASHERSQGLTPVVSNQSSPDLVSVGQTTTATGTSEKSREDLHLTKVERAVKLILEEFAEKLTVKEQVAAINAVRNENEASVFLMLRPTKLRKAWLFNEIGK